ncbi:MAG: PaaI family thioesterase [Hyphomicrobiaceae bacterium]
MSDTLSPAALKRINDIIIAGPFGEHVGMSVDDIEADRVVVRLHGEPHIMNALGIVHGGATATLLDTAATAAAWATPDARPTTRGTTVALAINYIGAGRAGDLVAEGRVISRGGTLTIVDVVARDTDGRLVAKAQATYKLDLARDRRLAGGG